MKQKPESKPAPEPTRVRAILKSIQFGNATRWRLIDPETKTVIITTMSEAMARDLAKINNIQIVEDENE
jgi:hypothetical protein